MLKERDVKSEFILAEELLFSSGDPQKCYQYLRMSKETFFSLLHILEPKIRKKDTNWRKSISPKHRLILTLRYDVVCVK